ncbi:hypothetical protein [Streptomyces sp. NBC_01601]|uniref:hypothetical protein n=1 Tax=Streptomyces sp. NBC_01601 TaxID=2975892 RepID=UPI002E29E57E|nr:hypothetical protein [Streptomyces sp. NBC_01601]
MPTHRLVANGASTDHPTPGLPFVDDAHLHAMLTSTPTAARHTRITDPEREELLWVIRTHPQLGRSVLLYAVDGPETIPTGEWQADAPLVVRAGGYWWDGACWYRPPLLWDAEQGAFEQHLVPAAATITAADLLNDPAADAARGHLHRVADLHEEQTSGHWLDDLALWAEHRTAASHQGPPLERCVVTLTAPELAGDNLIGTPALAAIAAITPSTLRAYMNRREGAVPQPQTVIGRRAMWSRPVAQDWAEQRRRPTADPWAAPRGKDGLPTGAEQIRDRLDPLFYAALHDDPARRARWALRYRSADAVHDVAGELARLAATELLDHIPGQALAEVLVQAALTNAGTRPAALETVLRWLSLHDRHAAELALSAMAAAQEGPGEDLARRLRNATSAAPHQDGDRPAAA